MERFNPELTLTSTEAAELLDVHVSTVKRWCNDGELAFSTTDGGHRRIHLEDAVAFARTQGIETVLSRFGPYEPHVWTALRQLEDGGDWSRALGVAMSWVHRGDLRRLGRLLELLAGSPKVPFALFCDAGVRELMRQVGDAWQEGRLRVGEEHMVSQCVVETLIGLRRRWLGVDDPYANGGYSGRAVVGATEGNHHHIGSLCVRILLETRGWRVSYLGPDVPIEDFGTVQKSRGAELVCVSLSSTGAPGDVGRAVGILREFYDPSRPYALAFGGSGLGALDPSLLEGPFERVEVFESCTGLQVQLDRLRAPAGAA